MNSFAFLGGGIGGCAAKCLKVILKVGLCFLFSFSAFDFPPNFEFPKEEQ